VTDAASPSNVSLNGPARAVLYVRVSTKDQARRDGNSEGYSLPTQRQTGEVKAESLGAVIVEEYLDKDTGTRTDKRPAMMRLLERVRDDQDVDYMGVRGLRDRRLVRSNNS